MFRKIVYVGVLMLMGGMSIERGLPGTLDSRPAGQEKLPLMITVSNPSAEFRTGMPVSGLIEFVAKNYFANEELCLKTPDQQQIPVQAQVLSTWPDGSARQIQLDFWDNFAPEQVRIYTLTRQPQQAITPNADWVTPLAQGIRVNTGKIEFRVTGENILENVHFDANSSGGYESSELVIKHGDFFLRQNGLDFQSSLSRAQIEILEEGALKCRLAVSGWLTNQHQESVAKYRLEIEAFRNQPYIYISPWIETLPLAEAEARVLKVHLSLFTPERLEKCHFGENPELQNVAIREWVRLIQERADFYKVTNQDGTFADGATGLGWVDVLNGDKNFTIYQRNFGKDSKGFLLRGNEILVYLWPPHAGFISPEKLSQFSQPADSGMSPHRILLYFHSGGAAPRQIVQTIATYEGNSRNFKVSRVMSELE